MTLRAILLGLLGACVICGLTYFNDAIMHQTMFVGNNMPLSVYGALILFVLLVNPFLYRVYKKLALSGKELAVILALTLAACCIPGSGLMRTFTISLVFPHHYARTEPGWQDQGVIEMVPKQMLVDVSKNKTLVVNGFIQGLPRPEGEETKQHISFFDIPWYAWARPLQFWLTIILALWIALIGLSVVVHRQWSDYEQLPYPIATFANSMLPEQSQGKGGVFSNKLFWIGTGAVLLIHLNNYACQWFPEDLIRIPVRFDFGRLGELFPTFIRGGGSSLLRPRFYFTAVAFAYFLATDVSLSLGVGPFLFRYVTGVFRGYGISLSGGGLFTPRIHTFLGFGAYFGMFLGLLYTGRYYYSNVLRRALFLPARERIEGHSIWAARIFLLAMGVFIFNLVLVGLNWQIAVLYAAGVVIIFLVMSRILAETGAFFIQAWWFPCVILAGLLGAKGLGTQALLIMLMLTSVLALDVREALMPFMVNSLKLLDLYRIKLGRSALLCGVAVVLGLAVAVPLTLYFQYDRGANLSDRWATRHVPRLPFEEVVKVKQRLIAQDSLKLSNSLSPWQRFSWVPADRSYLIGFGVGVVLVILFTVGRLRFANWPLHPVLFLVWHTYPGWCFAASFLVGCLIKVLVTKYGGAGGYQRVKPLMFGLIAGDMLGGVIPIIVGFVYYFATGELPKSFNIMPG